MSYKAKALFAGVVASGVYRTDLRTSARTLGRTAEHHGWQAFHLDGRELATKAEFLEASAGRCAFQATSDRTGMRSRRA